MRGEATCQQWAPSQYIQNSAIHEVEVDPTEVQEVEVREAAVAAAVDQRGLYMRQVSGASATPVYTACLHFGLSSWHSMLSAYAVSIFGLLRTIAFAAAALCHFVVGTSTYRYNHLW